MNNIKMRHGKIEFPIKYVWENRNIETTETFELIPGNTQTTLGKPYIELEPRLKRLLIRFLPYSRRNGRTGSWLDLRLDGVLDLDLFPAIPPVSMKEIFRICGLDVWLDAPRLSGDRPFPRERPNELGAWNDEYRVEHLWMELSDFGESTLKARCKFFNIFPRVGVCDPGNFCVTDPLDNGGLGIEVCTEAFRIPRLGVTCVARLTCIRSRDAEFFMDSTISFSNDSVTDYIPSCFTLRCPGLAMSLTSFPQTCIIGFTDKMSLISLWLLLLLALLLLSSPKVIPPKIMPLFIGHGRFSVGDECLTGL